MIRLYGLTAFAAAALLFAVEPMAAKALLPTLGGSASVWATCLAFFQTALLVGYAYAHLTTRLAPRSQAMLHLVLLGACVATRPSVIFDASTAGPAAGADPSGWLVGNLAATLGLPFVAVAATSSLLQRWYAASRPLGEANPYPLYAASNLGSLLALLAYPLAMEPRLALADQARGWWAGFVGFAALMAGCSIVAWRSARYPEQGKDGRFRASWGEWALWIGLAFVPSSLLQGVTFYLSTDIAPIPLLWVVPLGIYLLSFVLTFAERPPLSRTLLIRLLPMAVILLMPSFAGGLVRWFWLPVHLACFFVAAMVCHGELARRRPPAGGLTGFYLALSIGGVFGSLFNAVVAPALFDRAAEYPVGIVLACLVLGTVPRPGRTPERLGRSMAAAATIGTATAVVAVDPGAISGTAAGALCVILACGLFAYVALTHDRRPIGFALSVGAVAAALGLSPGVDGRVLLRERNFYGVLRVHQDDKARARRLFHGWTLHGQQSIEPGREREPTSYYLPGGPGAQVFDAINARPDASRARVAVVGLGIGSLASYAKAGQSWTFYELDPAIERIARDERLFTFLRDSPAAPIGVVLGDARLRLGAETGPPADLIVLDAFSSDAIPVHLLTREALAAYLHRRAPHGLVAFHISNRYLDLEPLLGALARDAGLVGRVRNDRSVSPEEKARGKQPSIWLVMADVEHDLGAIASDPRWERLREARRGWADDQSSLLDVLSAPGR